jgi:hypothetical protein
MRDELSGPAADSLELYGLCRTTCCPGCCRMLSSRTGPHSAALHRVDGRGTAAETGVSVLVGRTHDHPRKRRGARAGVGGPGYFVDARYNYCLLVDEVCLEPLDMGVSPVVKLVWKDLQTRGKAEAKVAVMVALAPTQWVASSEGWEDGVTDCDEEDVSWMFVPVADYVDCCNQLHEPRVLARWVLCSRGAYLLEQGLRFSSRVLEEERGFEAMRSECSSFSDEKRRCLSNEYIYT